MKPSEVLIGNMILEYCNSDDEYYLCENTSTNITTQIKALDKQFINREELKKKIKKIFDNHNCYFSDKFDEFEFNNVKREILELIK